jgi:hypothetical protein
MPFKSSFLKDHPDARTITKVIINAHRHKSLSYVDTMALSNLKLKFLMNQSNPDLSLSELKQIDKIVAKIEHCDKTQ